MDGSKRRLERLACDRCHRQKLRCSRASSQSRACQRCVKAGERCTYSPPLRLGRPVSSNKQDKHGRLARASPSTSPATPPMMAHQHESRHGTPTTCVDAAAAHAEDMDMPVESSLSLRIACQPPPSSASPTIVAMPEPQAADYLMDPTSAMDKAFLIAAEDLDVDYRHGIPLTATMMLDMDPESQPPQPPPHLSAPPTCDMDELYLYGATPYPPEALLDDRPQLGVLYDDPERQLLALQQSLFDAVAVDEVDGLKKTIGLTTRASNVLLGIITGLTSPAPSSSCSSSSESPPLAPCSRHLSGGSGTTTMLLVAACYARILRNVDAIAARLHDMVSCGDHEALLALPCIQIGTFIPATLVAPAIQTSVLVQLLSQSVCEIEKRLPSLTRALLDHPAPMRGPGGRSNAADMIGAVNSNVANLEAHVKSVLSITQDLLSHDGGFHREHRGYTME